MLDIGKQKGRKNQVKLVQCVNKLKQKYISLRKTSRLADISWTKFHHQHMSTVHVNYVKMHIYINCLMSRLSQLRIIINQTIFHFHYLIRNIRGKGS